MRQRFGSHYSRLDTRLALVSARELYEQLIAAWDSRNADAFAALFGSDGAMIGFDGSEAAGTKIREHLEQCSDHETAAYVAKVHETRSLGGDVEILRTVVGMVPPASNEVNPKANALQTLIAQGGRGSNKSA